MNKNWKEHGLLLPNGCLAFWPAVEDGYEIRVVSAQHRCVERVEKGSPRWDELRRQMPDDALYFQPDEAGDHDCPTSAHEIKSYQVYRDYENAQSHHPDCEILAFAQCEIEEPKFLDVKEPKLFFNPCHEQEIGGEG